MVLFGGSRDVLSRELCTGHGAQSPILPWFPHLQSKEPAMGVFMIPLLSGPDLSRHDASHSIPKDLREENSGVHGSFSAQQLCKNFFLPSYKSFPIQSKPASAATWMGGPYLHTDRSRMRSFSSS